jgi:hypothetical protein
MTKLFQYFAYFSYNITHSTTVRTVHHHNHRRHHHHCRRRRRHQCSMTVSMRGLEHKGPEFKPAYSHYDLLATRLDKRN